MIERRSTALMLGGERDASAVGFSVAGIAVPYGSDSVPLPFIENFAPGAFRDQLGENFDGVTGQFQHDSVFVLASVDSGTMNVTDSPTGLRFSMRVPSSLAYVREVVEAGIVAGASVGFQALADEWSADPITGDPRRLVTRAVLAEVSLVSRPAFPAATAGITLAPRDRSVRHGRVGTLKPSEAAGQLADRVGTMSLADARRKLDERERGRVEEDLRRHLLRARWDKVAAR
jgi:hypothetical protein